MLVSVELVTCTPTFISTKVRMASCIASERAFAGFDGSMTACPCTTSAKQADGLQKNKARTSSNGSQQNLFAFLISFSLLSHPICKADQDLRINILRIHIDGISFSSIF